MKVSELWLREWVSLPLTGQQLSEQLTMAGLEVDGVHPVAGNFTQVIVAKVVKTMPHPDADRLTLCEVDKGVNETLSIVCGASNVRAGLMVALALPGAVLPNGLVIKESKLRGQLSQGMLCSASELGLEEQSEGIIELPEDAPIGVSIRDYLSLDDKIYELDLTPNRADCFSLLGVAREVAALNRLPFKNIEHADIKPIIEDSRDINVQEPQACGHYCGRVIRGININAETPMWMKERLRRSGVRVVHPVVDVTNYVMLELGQPMHAYDLQHIQGQIHVRFNLPEETLILLGGQTITLNDAVLVIADEEKVLGLAGVMGGEASSVHKETCDVFLESAYFNPLNIAGVARRYGLSSDASIRFERGVDPSIQLKAIERATQLILSIAGGEPGPVTESKKVQQAQTTVQFNPELVKQLTGVDLPENDMKGMLQHLGMIVTQLADHWEVRVPSHRFDIQLAVDLVEEIVRLYGYNNIQSQPSLGKLQIGQLNQTDTFLTQATSFLCAKGYRETISYSFVDPQLQKVLYPKASEMELLNPISSELSVMRVGLWPGLLASMLYNVHRQQRAIQLFESGVVFEKDKAGIKERACLAGLMTGETNVNWNEETRAFDFYDMKGDLQALLISLLKLDVAFVSDVHDALHPGQTARILANGQPIGWLGVLHPRIADLLDLSQDILLFELSLEHLPKQSLSRYQKISKYPLIKRDLSLLVDEAICASQIEAVVRQVVDKSLLKDFEVFDVYKGEGIGHGKKSLAISLTIQDDNRTLIDREINDIIDAIISKLDKDLAIKLRE